MGALHQQTELVGTTWYNQVQRAAVLALQALTRLCSSLEGEDVAIQRVVDLETVPILARALRNYPEDRPWANFHEDPQMQERGLDVLRLLSTRRDAVTQQLCGDGTFVPAIVEAMNLNISKPKEYGLSLLAEVGWQGVEQQRVVLSNLGVEVVVRALKAFPNSGDVQTVGLAAVQAITSDNEECRVKFFSLCEILEIVLQAMGNFPLLEGVQAFGCAALISLVHSKSERIGALADLNCASMAESAMVGHPKSQRVFTLKLAGQVSLPQALKTRSNGFHCNWTGSILAWTTPIPAMFDWSPKTFVPWPYFSAAKVGRLKKSDQKFHSNCAERRHDAQ
eukprot:s17_g41.t1